jgi:hypothetical protein
MMVILVEGVYRILAAPSELFDDFLWLSRFRFSRFKNSTMNNASNEDGRIISTADDVVTLPVRD